MNAINYNVNPKKKIIIRAYTLEEISRSNTILEFIDNGIRKENSRKEIIFHKEYKAEKGSKGMGLEFSLVKNFITLYYGKIWIEN